MGLSLNGAVNLHPKHLYAERNQSITIFCTFIFFAQRSSWTIWATPIRFHKRAVKLQLQYQELPHQKFQHRTLTVTAFLWFFITEHRSHIRGVAPRNKLCSTNARTQPLLDAKLMIQVGFLYRRMFFFNDIGCITNSTFKQSRTIGKRICW